MNSIKVSSTSSQYRQDITVGDKFNLTADQPLELNGDDAGPTPMELLLASLGSCKTITIKMYAERKGWELTKVDVELTYQKVNHKYEISSRLHLEGNLTDEQRQRLLQLADKCPVHKLIKSEAKIETILIDSQS